MRLSIVLSVIGLSLGLAGQSLADTVNIFAAASTSDAIEEIIDAYTPPIGTSVGGIYAASSTLAQQIEAGAPADIYLSANEAWMDDLASRERIAAGTRVDLLTNDLVLVAPRMLPLDYTPGGEVSLAGVLDEGLLAIGDPDTVPAGIYAREALTNLGEWDALSDNLIPGDSVRTALTWAARAEVRAAIVYGSDTYSTMSVSRVATFPADSHSPIVYPMGMIAGSEDRPAVLAFYEFLRGPEAADIFEAYGFGLADE